MHLPADRCIDVDTVLARKKTSRAWSMDNSQDHQVLRAAQGWRYGASQRVLRKGTAERSGEKVEPNN